MIASGSVLIRDKARETVFIIAIIGASGGRVYVQNEGNCVKADWAGCTLVFGHVVTVAFFDSIGNLGQLSQIDPEFGFKLIVVGIDRPGDHAAIAQRSIGTVGALPIVHGLGPLASRL